jgi:hypothetical protein
MTFGAEIWGPPLIAAGASWLSGQGSAGQETKMEKTKRKLVDKLLDSLSGEGPYSDLFAKDESIFHKSFVEPAQSLFRNQIAPRIQQAYGAQGQQRGTPMEDTLTRAGVDLDSELNKYMYQFKQSTINSILGGGAGAQNETSGGQDIMSGLGGYLSSSPFANQFSGFFKAKDNSSANTIPQRKGFEQDY